MVKKVKNSNGLLALCGLIGVTIFSGFLLSSSLASADDSIVDKVKITVPVSCTMSGTGMNSHTATVRNNEYTQNIGTTTLHAFCNDTNGFAIYAAGYTGDEIGGENSTKLIGTPATIGNINTGTATSGSTSNWAMKLAITQDSGNTTGTNAVTIDNNFNTYHAVPNEYTKVAHKNTATDMTAVTGGVKLTTTYATFMSQNQPAGTYQGKVIYTLVHPSDKAVPKIATLDTGQNINQKIKRLAGNSTATYNTINNTITAFVRSDTLPNGFTPSDANTISISPSRYPVYAWYDSSNTTIYYYSEATDIMMNEDSSNLFSNLYVLSELSTISSWDTSNVTNMSSMFYSAGYNATSWSVGDLSSWNTSSVTSMSQMFRDAGKSATTWSVGNLSSWDTSKVTSMSSMFSFAGRNATTWSVGDLSSWDTSNVTNMSSMFSFAGSNATTWSVGDLSSWDTSKVTSMSSMFSSTGENTTSWSVGDLSSWDTSKVTSMSSMFSSAGRNATTWSVGDLSSWGTSNVTNMSSMFSSAGYKATTFVLNLSSWNTSNVKNMSTMFYEAGYNATAWSVGNLSSWNTSNVTDMSYMFSAAGYKTTVWSVGNISSWNTSKVIDFAAMFQQSGYSSLSYVLDLSSWNTSNVTNMSYMFNNAGYKATTFTLNLSSWDTSSVSNMSNMLTNVGYNAATWSITIPKTNNGTATGPILNTASNLYGSTTSVTATPPSGKSFTLAN